MADRSALEDPAFLSGGGDMGALMRSCDWSTFELGDVEDWPRSLRSAISICLNSQAIGAIYWGPDFRLLYNDAYRPFLGSRHPSALGCPMSEIWPTMWQALEATARQVYETGQGVVTANQRLLMERDGGLVETFWFYNFAPIRGDAGQVDGILVTALDTTQHVVAERELRELNQTLESRVAEQVAERYVLASLFDITDVMIMAIDLDYNIVALNKANADEFERIYGVRPKVGDNMLGLLADKPEHQAQVREGWGRGLAGEEVTFVEDYGEPDRKRPYYEIKFRTLRNEAGAPAGTYQFVTDVTDRLREQAQLAEAQEALRQSQKLEAMGSLTGGVAHDFNNLLTPIIGSLDMLIRKGIGSDREQRLIKGGLQSAERAKTLVQRLLAFARRQPLQASAVDVFSIVDNMAALLGSTLGPTIRMYVDVGKLPPVKTDPNQLEMALLNIAVNARDAMPEGGTLTITAKHESVGEHQAQGITRGDYVRLSVRDTGIGMDDETRRRAIEPFFSTKGIGKGTGLGLSMVHGLAAQLGGGLTIESAIGQGTSIELWLPISGTLPNDEKFAVASPPTRAGRGTVLLVDDEELVRMTTADMLVDLGFEVVEADSAEDALRLIKEGTRPDLLVTDHLMPGMNGAELAREACRLQPALPVLLVSGYAQIEGIAPDLPRLVKPFRNADLAASISALVLAGSA